MKLVFNGDKLKKERLNHGLTMGKLSEETGISQPSISAFENYKKNPRPEAVAKLGEFFNLNPIQFYIDDSVVVEAFPPEMSAEVISFVRNKDNLGYIEMAIQLKEANVTQKLLESLLTIVANSRTNRDLADKKYQ